MGGCNEKARELVQAYLEADAEEILGAVFNVLFVLQVREQLVALRVLKEVERYVRRSRMDHIIETLIEQNERVALVWKGFHTSGKDWVQLSSLPLSRF